MPYRQSYTFDVFGNLIERQNLHWGNNKNSGHAFTNNRITGFTNDADGRQLLGYDGTYYTVSTSDAAGQLTVYNRALGDDQYELLTSSAVYRNYVDGVDIGVQNTEGR